MNEVTINWESLTVDEVNLIEEACDADLEDIQAGNIRKGRVLRAFALLAQRRQNGVDAAEEITPDELKAAGKVDVKGLGGLFGERPTGAAAPPATRTSAASRKPAGSRSKGSRG